jgi:hypothetical protein
MNAQPHPSISPELTLVSVVVLVLLAACMIGTESVARHQLFTAKFFFRVTTFRRPARA